MLLFEFLFLVHTERLNNQRKIHVRLVAIVERMERDGKEQDIY